MFFLLVLNTLVAIFIGLLVANVLRPGKHASLPAGDAAEDRDQPARRAARQHPGQPAAAAGREQGDRRDHHRRRVRRWPRGGWTRRRRRKILAAIEIGFDLILIVLHWIIALVPLAVFGKVAAVIGEKGFEPFVALGVVHRRGARRAAAAGDVVPDAREARSRGSRRCTLIRGTRDALVMAFSTASSTATMPVTYACLRQKVGLREESASLGSLVGANFNNDGTALYEAMAALFIAQMLGVELTLTQQLLVVLTSVVASVGAAGIPEAGLVTMTLVFTAVGLPTEYIALLLPVDWFLDRCRTVHQRDGRHERELPARRQDAAPARARPGAGGGGGGGVTTSWSARAGNSLEPRDELPRRLHTAVELTRPGCRRHRARANHGMPSTWYWKIRSCRWSWSMRTGTYASLARPTAASLKTLRFMYWHGPHHSAVK